MNCEISETLKSTLKSLASNPEVRCRKTRKTAEHCPNHTSERVCHTRAEVFNFFTGTAEPKKDEKKS